MNIPYSQELMCNIIPILKNFKYHMISYRELHKNFNDLPGEPEFWAYTCDAHIQMAAISWCMVFGTDSNPTHWKNLSQGNVTTLMNYVREKTEISEREYITNWEAIKDFRNMYVAHKKGYDKPVPFFSFAEMIVDYFELWAKEMFHPEELEQYVPLNDLWEVCTQDINTVIECIIKHD